MMRNYQHKHDDTRAIVAIQLNSRTLDEVAEWTNGRVLEGSVAVEVPVQGGASSVVAVEDDYILLDENYQVHVRSPQIFEAKYRPSDTQDEELDFSGSTGPGGYPLNDDGYIESDEKGFIPSTDDELSGDEEDAGRLQ